MSSAPSTAAEINRLHGEVLRNAQESKKFLHAALVAAWKAGKLLAEEKRRVGRKMGRGAWLHWLEQCFHGSPRTAQKYMRLAAESENLDHFQGLSLRQVYFRLGIATEPKTRSDSPRIEGLPKHIRLAHKLVVALEDFDENSETASSQTTRACQDLRVLYERLRRIFEKDAARAFLTARAGSFVSPMPSQNGHASRK